MPLPKPFQYVAKKLSGKSRSKQRTPSNGYQVHKMASQEGQENQYCPTPSLNSKTATAGKVKKKKKGSKSVGGLSNS